MRASELIARLQELMEEHGDLPVTGLDVAADVEVAGVSAFDRYGNKPIDYDAVEFWLSACG